MGRLPCKETLKVFMNMQLARIKLVMPVDREHGSRMDHTVLEPTTYPMTQVGYNFMLAMYKKNECCQSVNVCVNMMQEKFSHFSLGRLKKTTRQDANCVFSLELGTVANSNYHLYHLKLLPVFPDFSEQFSLRHYKV
jgi:hypothetical protein